MTTEDPKFVEYQSDLELVTHEDPYTGEFLDQEWQRQPDQSGDAVRANRPLELEKIQQAEHVHGLVQAGHGFTVWTVTRDDSDQVQTTCRFCGVVLGGMADDWLCELGSPTGSEEWLHSCQCNWCECRRQYERGILRDKGRPRVQCGSVECKRKLRNEQQRNRRQRQKAA
ncbi:hypothetical protein [Mycobacteroides abscessus]|uniref:hypothetical protein n=1 Tax=Mycobacteroides abscessus TaxID=36809 RepID=UPI0002585135|nr:hypothetical protein [Mycobacteroides abscessus]EIC67167.1 hypothetical protein OUW_05523 [Mycobacteroides abscessus M93]